VRSVSHSAVAVTLPISATAHAHLKGLLSILLSGFRRR
jgi:hypothetical protein